MADVTTVSAESCNKACTTNVCVGGWGGGSGVHVLCWCVFLSNTMRLVRTELVALDEHHSGEHSGAPSELHCLF